MKELQCKHPRIIIDTVENYAEELINADINIDDVKNVLTTIVDVLSNILEVSVENKQILEYLHIQSLRSNIDKLKNDTTDELGEKQEEIK